MKINQVIQGFRIDNIRFCKAIDGKIYEFVHQKTKAKLLWLDRKDDNKSFIIGFKTISTDSTGVFHILEHSLLNGSERYPVKEPFVDLLKGSLQTFLNALTFPDKTLYPVSSRNTKDFYNLMRVYLDGVFAPNCIKNPYIFAQEGWRYQINEVKQEIQYKGVVYSEMQGAFASGERIVATALQNNLFPDNCYGYVSGGDPNCITDLTYQQFVDTYHKFYNPTNSYIVLDGSLDIKETLKIIDQEYLSKFEIGPNDYQIINQKPLVKPIVYQPYSISENEDIKDKLYIDFGYVVSDYTDKQKTLAFTILSTVLTDNNQSILAKEIISKGLAEDVDFIMSDDLQQSYVEIFVTNAKDGCVDEIKTTIEETLKKLIKDGIDKEELIASLNKMEFALREKDFGDKPKGLIYGINALTDWMRGSDPLKALDLDEELALIREKIQTNYFEDLIQRYILNSNHSCVVVGQPSKTLNQENQQKLRKKLLEYKQSLSVKQLNDLLQFNQDFNKWQQKPDSKVAKKKLPSLKLKDIDDKVEKTKYEVVNIDDITVLKYPNNTEGIDYANMYFDISDLDDQQLTLLSLIIDLLSQMPSKKHDANQLNKYKKMYLGNFDVSPLYIQNYNDDKYSLKVMVNFSCLSQNREKAIEIVNEILYDCLFNDKKEILDCLKQSKNSMQQHIIQMGVKLAMLEVEACFNELYAAKEKVEGLSYYNYLKDFINNFDENKLNQLIDLYSQIFTRNRLTISVMGPDQDEIANKIVARCKQDDRIIGHIYHDLLDKKNRGLIIPSDVSFAVKAADLYQETRDARGQLVVTNKILSLDYLWNEVRAKNGAYGVGATSIMGILTYYSYRDPNALKTLDIYNHVTDYLEQLVVSKPNLTNYVIGSIGDLDPLLTNFTAMKQNDLYFFRNLTYDDICQLRQQVLDFNNEQLEQLIDIYKKAQQEGVIFVVGSKKTIQQIEDIELLEL